MAYHHGNLKEALVDAALATARLDGPDAVVLRAATRASGVSPNAAYRHFADRDELLGAVAGRCMVALTHLIETRLAQLSPGGDRAQLAWQRLRAAGRAYVEFALTEPGWFRTAFSAPGATAGSPRPEPDPFSILNAVLDELVAAGALPAERRPGAEYPAWAAVHGIASLLVDGPLRELPAAARDDVVDRVVEVVAGGL